MGANGYASGDAVAFASAPDLRLAAHEAAHIVQQRGGVRLSGGVGRAGDEYEQHADAVADRVVRGESAEALLDTMAHRGAGGGAAVQHQLHGARRPAQIERRMPLPETYEAFEAEAQSWIARQVASRSPADGHDPAAGERVPDEQRIHRERDLVQGNPSLRRVWDGARQMQARELTLIAQLEWSAGRIEAIEFTSDAMPIDMDEERIEVPRPGLEYPDRVPSPLDRFDSLVDPEQRRQMIERAVEEIVAGAPRQAGPRVYTEERAHDPLVPHLRGYNAAWRYVFEFGRASESPYPTAMEEEGHQVALQRYRDLMRQQRFVIEGVFAQRGRIMRSLEETLEHAEHDF
jgi:hypothetical protein